MLQKNLLAKKKKKKSDFMHRFKSAIFQFVKWHFWTPAWNLIFLAKNILLMYYENDNKKKKS